LKPKTNKKLVYVAGKLNSDAVGYIRNIHLMIKEARKLRIYKEHLSVYVPANDFLEGVVCGDFDYDNYFQNSQAILERSDAVYVCPNWESSQGTKREIEYAEEMGIPAFYYVAELLKFFNLDDGLPF